MAAPLLEVEDLRTEFRTLVGTVPAVRGVSFRVERGETVGIVGESGSGKSVTALSLMRLVPNPPGRIVGGSVRLEGKELLALPEREMQQVRGERMAMVFQDPFSSLDPTMTLGAQVAEPIRLHTGVSRSEAKRQALRLLQAVRIPSPEIRYRQYPHQVSGGQRQRVMIAIAFACNPELLIADEPTTALDVTVQAQILALMADMQKKTNAGILLITHDLGVVAEVCDRVLVMYAGTIVESGTVDQIFTAPKHPYTQGLLASLPQISTDRSRRLVSIPGQPPDLAHLPPGCPFFDRCPQRMPDICPTREPQPTTPEPGQRVRCYLYGG
ncbi:MAG TPA: ABC transporter ATP-binding protein [Chthonomonadaceae bacterium]|nr:ABC transporter ATP-binding protein [Chthonomonadaceae bacterium]